MLQYKLFIPTPILRPILTQVLQGTHVVEQKSDPTIQGKPISLIGAAGMDRLLREGTPAFFLHILPTKEESPSKEMLQASDSSSPEEVKQPKDPGVFSRSLSTLSKLNPITMSFTSPSTVIGAPNPVSPPVFPPPHPNSAEMPVDAAINELASTIEEAPSRSTSLVPLYFWQARGKKEANCSIVPTLLVAVIAIGLRTFDIFHISVPVTWCLLWRNIAEKIEANQQELDFLELSDFLCKQPQVPGPPTTSSLPPPSPSVMATPCVLVKKRKRSVQQEEGGSSWRKRPVGKVLELDVVPEAHNCKHKCPVGGSWDAEVPDYCRVVLVLRPPLVDTPDSAALSGGPVNEIGRSLDLLTHKWSNLPGLSNQFVPPVVPEHRSAVLHPYPTAALKADNEALWAEVADLRKLLEASRTGTSTLTSLLWDTSTSLNNCYKDLEASHCALQDVAADCLEYNHVLAQFRAIEAELPEAPLEDALTQFHLAVDSYREVAIRQKQELLELREQVDKEQKQSYEAHEELDAANARAIHLQDCLEELQESVHRYRTRAHAAEELIRKFPEDEGLYEVDLPSLSSLQDKLTASEAMLCQLLHSSQGLPGPP
ncbi:MAG: hypothetical protein NXY57DRAFT_968964 [Lentinula lateritia]|nr:MAG: hypothetical protein NXY57DRAFT_968964 [Lentinula lateritia]